jgi:RND family efflux transporter MFP subunit
MPQADRLPILTAALWVAVGLSGCDQGQSQKAAPPPPQVTVATPVTKKVVAHDEYVGRFVAVDAVEVRARVSGYLDSIHFQDGQMVKKGDLLFTIDRRPFQNALDQARASLEQAKANLAYAEADLARAKGLVGGNVISQQTFEQRTQAKRVAEANVAAQDAALRQASLDLEFTELRAPVSGRIGDRRVSPCNLVTGGTTGTTTLLATIQSTDPIRFEFTMDETSYLRYLRLAKKGPDVANVPVKLKLLDEASFSHKGRAGLVDNAIDRPRHHPRPCRVSEPGRDVHAWRSDASRWHQGRPATRRWYPTSPSAPSRCASTCSSSTIRMWRAPVCDAGPGRRRDAGHRLIDPRIAWSSTA